MYTSLQAKPISHLARKPKSVLESLRKGPIFLTQHGKEYGVLLSSEEWRRIVKQADELEDAYDLIAALKAELRLSKGETKATPIDIDLLNRD